MGSQCNEDKNVVRQDLLEDLVRSHVNWFGFIFLKLFIYLFIALFLRSDASSDHWVGTYLMSSTQLISQQVLNLLKSTWMTVAARRWGFIWDRLKKKNEFASSALTYQCVVCLFCFFPAWCVMGNCAIHASWGAIWRKSHRWLWQTPVEVFLSCKNPSFMFVFELPFTDE